MDERYLKSTAIVRAYEKKMLDTAGRLRLLSADESTVGRLLDGLLPATFGRWRALVEELVPEDDLRAGLLAFFDFRNVIILASAENPGDDFYPDGQIKIDTLRKYFTEKKVAEIYQPLRTYLSKIFAEKLDNQSNLNYINWLVFWADYFYYPWVKDLSPNGFWQGYWAHLIDLLNLRYLVRRLSSGADPAFPFIPGGWLDPGQLKSGRNQELRQFVQKPFLQDYRRIFDFSTEDEYEFRRRLEKNIRKFLLDYLRPAKLLPYGLEPVFAFLEGFLLDGRNVNFIVVSKKMKIEPELIKENYDASYI